MRAWPLFIDAKNNLAVPASGVACLIGGIGTEAFAQTMLDAVRRDVAMSFSSLAFRPATQNGSHIGYGTAGDRSVGAAALGYDRLHLYDRDTRWCPPVDQGCNAWISVLKCNDVEALWHDACYRPWDIVERCSIVADLAHGKIAASFFRCRDDGPFSDGDIERISVLAPVFIAAARQHDRLTAMANIRPGIPSHLRTAFEVLSRREKQVIIGSFFGKTEKQIAMELGVSLNTIITYRRRAYVRLGITSKNQLVSDHMAVDFTVI